MANFLKKSVLVTFHTLRAHKTLFISLVFLQLLILVLLFTHAFQAQLAIGKDIQQLGTQIQQANYNPDELKEGKPFVQDPLQMLQLYHSLKRNLLLFVVQFSSIFLFGQGILWLGTHRFLKKYSLRETAQQALKYFVTVLFFYGLFFLGAYFVLKSQVSTLDMQSLSAILRYLGYIFLGVYYLLTVALGVVHISAWKDFFLRWFALAVKKYYLCIPLLFFSLLPVAGAFLGIFYAVQIKSSFPLMMLFTAGVVVFLVLGRIFFMAVMQEMIPEKNLAVREAGHNERVN